MKVRVFVHPTNGHEETVKGISALWAFLFGWIYFLVKGIWVHALIELLLVGFAMGAFGEASFIFILVIWIAYAAFTPTILARSFLKQGWIEKGAPVREVAGTDPVLNENNKTAPTPLASIPEPSAVMRDCPFCAEPIRAAAIKCKHCGSSVATAD